MILLLASREFASQLVLARLGVANVFMRVPLHRLLHQRRPRHQRVLRKTGSTEQDQNVSGTEKYAGFKPMVSWILLWKVNGRCAAKGSASKRHVHTYMYVSSLAPTISKSNTGFFVCMELTTFLLLQWSWKLDWLDFRQDKRNNNWGYDVSPLILHFSTSDVLFSTISTDLKGFDNNLQNIEKCAFSKSQNTTF